MSRPPRPYDLNAPLELLDDAVAQWLDWEEQANLIGFRTSTSPVEVEVTHLPREACEVYVLSGAPARIIDQFLDADTVHLPKHPLNRDPTVSGFAAPVAQRWTGRFTASRTLAMPGAESGSALFSLKLATDHPHPDFHQPEKTKLREEALGAVEWSNLLDRTDAKLPPLAAALLVREVLVVLVRDSETGFMVRDLREFQNGRYYLPALSLPFVGRQIASRNGESPASFWGAAFASLVGRSKAELFARYGLWYETPNPQNIVVPLERSLAPTGRLVFRDVGDGECSTDAFETTEAPWTRLQSDLRPETENSFWAFGEAGEHSLERDTLIDWYRRHDDAYYSELASWFPKIAPAAEQEASRKLEHWNRVLRSDEGSQAVVERFHELALAASPAN